MKHPIVECPRCGGQGLWDNLEKKYVCFNCGNDRFGVKNDRWMPVSKELL